MSHSLLTATVAIGLILPLAGAEAAASKKRRAYEYDHHYGIALPAQASVGMMRRGPPWAMPNECFNDEGYGRWSPCGGRDH